MNEFDITEELSGDSGEFGAAGGNAGGDHDFFGDIKKDIDAKVY